MKLWDDTLGEWGKLEEETGRGQCGCGVRVQEATERNAGVKDRSGVRRMAAVELNLGIWYVGWDGLWDDSWGLFISIVTLVSP